MGNDNEQDSKRQPIILRAADAMWRVSMLALAAVIVVKVAWLNDVTSTLRDDPLDLWVAIGIAFLLTHAGVTRRVESAP